VAGGVGRLEYLLDQVPEAGRIYVLRNGQPEPKDAILSKWRQTLFLREQSVDARGWLIDVMKAVDAIGRAEFSLEDVYALEARLKLIYPNNNNVRPKIRQQMQVLRDSGYLDFVRRGQYRLRNGS
jgi:type II restriction enzyme